MADEIREYVRAAQEAEINGDRANAAELLWKAAHLAKSAGKQNRALGMLRHAQRLDPGRTDIAEEIRRLEWLPEQPMRAALADDELEEEVKAILAPLNLDEDEGEAPDIHGAPPLGVIPGGPPRDIPDRAPVLADAGKDAWCSFCCRPAKEVGPLVAGAAGAYVCASCVEQSARLLDVEPTPIADVPARIEREPEPSAPRAFEMPAQAAARKDLEQALSLGLRRVLLLGEAGAGKSALFKALADEGKGRLLTGATVTAHPPDDTLLFIDPVEGLEPQGWNRLLYHLEKHPGPAVLAMRGAPGAQAAAFLLTEDARVGLPSTAALLQATGGKLPVEVAEQVDAVVALETPDDAALQSLAAHLLSARGLPEDFVKEAAPLIASQAAASERRAHELVAQVRRVPRGAWKLEPAAAEKKPRGRGKKKG